STRPPLPVTAWAPTTMRISGLNRTAGALAVYASQSGSLRYWQDSLPAAGQALPDRIGYLQGPYQRFPECFLHPFLLSQSSPDALRVASSHDSEYARCLASIFAMYDVECPCSKSWSYCVSLRPPRGATKCTGIARFVSARRRAGAVFRQI